MKIMHDDKKIRGIVNSVNDLETEKATLSDVETLLASGDVEDIKADSIIENMNGYAFYGRTPAKLGVDYVYAGAVKNGNKLTLAIAMNITPSEVDNSLTIVGNFAIPAEVWNKLIPSNIGGFGNAYEIKSVGFRRYADVEIPISVMLQQGASGIVNVYLVNKGWTADETYYGRIEATFLLSENLAPTE